LGQKTHPIGFRLGVIRSTDSRWFADKRTYRDRLHNDHLIRQYVKKKLGKGNISRVDIERSANKVTVTLFTARPGAVIGRGGKGIDDLTLELQGIVSKSDKDARVHVNVSQVHQPEADAQLVAENIATQLERRISHRRAMRQSIRRALGNARGIKIICSGRLNGADIARSESEKMGKIPLHTLRADIDYGKAEANTTYGVVGVRVWIYRGEVLPEKMQMALASPKEKPTRRRKEEEAQPAVEEVISASDVVSTLVESASSPVDESHEAVVKTSSDMKEDTPNVDA
jgi:small subunit ribosomal protein S3